MNDNTIKKDISIDYLDLPRRASKIFKERKIMTLSDLLELEYKDFQYLPEIGVSTLFLVFQRMLALQIDIMDKKSLSNIQKCLPVNTPVSLIEKLLADKNTFKKPRVYTLMHLSDYISTIREDRDRDIFCRLLNGETLESVGSSFKITRERVRQIRNKILSKRPPLIEDAYRSFFCEYKFSEESFCKIFAEDKKVFFYLNSVYKKGETSIENIIKDEALSEESRKRIEKLKSLILKENEKIVGDIF